MIRQAGYAWPDDVGTKWQHALKHVRSLEWAIARCRQHRTAVQAGGNVGLWPARMAEVFARVITFEPDAISRACLAANVPATVEVRAEALGDRVTTCGLLRQSLGSHCVVTGSDIPVIPVDSLGLLDLDLLQLDVEGYEWHVLTGAAETIRRCRPLVQVELRGFTTHYGKADVDVRRLLAGWGYQAVSEQPGCDVVFEAA